MRRRIRVRICIGMLRIKGTQRGRGRHRRIVGLCRHRRLFLVLAGLPIGHDSIDKDHKESQHDGSSRGSCSGGSVAIKLFPNVVGLSFEGGGHIFAQSFDDPAPGSEERAKHFDSHGYSNVLFLGFLDMVLGIDKIFDSSHIKIDILHVGGRIVLWKIGPSVPTKPLHFFQQFRLVAAQSNGFAAATSSARRFH